MLHVYNINQRQDETKGRASAMQYAIHEDIYPTIEKKLVRIANKCKKYGNDFVFSIVGEDMRKDKKGYYNKFFIIDVEGTAKVDGWEFIASMDVYESGNIIRKCNNDVEIPQRFWNSENICDHCHTKRQRNTLYIIRNTETGEFKQVGGTCLASYTHGLDMELVVSWLDGIDKLEENNGVFHGGSGKHYHSVKDVLAYAHIIIKKMGYLKNDYDNPMTTKGLVCSMIMPNIFATTFEKRVDLMNKDIARCGYDVQFSVSDFMQDVSADVQNIIDYYLSCESNSEFIHNVQTILKEEYVDYKGLGFICYLPQGYAKHMDTVTTLKFQKHEHYGEVGKRYKNVAVKSVYRAASFDTDYGIKNVWNITIEDGTVLTWKTTNYIEDGFSTIDFTVKSHGEYKGKKQTEVTRCKIHYNGQAAA